MNIFFDHQAFSMQDYGGVSRIFAELISGIKQKNHNAHLSILYSKNIYLKEKNLDPKTVLKDFYFFKKRPILSKINALYNALDLSASSFHIYHPTYYNPNLISFAKKKPVVVTFHDMIHEKFGHRFVELLHGEKLIEQKKYIANEAAHIIAVSENTKHDLIDIYGVPPSKITVIYLGNSFWPDPALPKHKLSMQYILYVGNRDLYKNFIPFLKSISQLLKRHGLLLMCAGGKIFNKKEMSIIEELNVGEHLVQQSVDDRLLAQLYSNAIAFVFPSLYEGFGIPILEAFACKCPCIVSNGGSLPEVAGNAAIYFDPSNSDSMYNAVEMIINDDSLRKSLIIKGEKRLENFSWNKHINETLNVYSELVNE